MTVLSANMLTVRRGGRAILNEVSARIEPGAFVAVIGANGAGKSTLLSALAGLLKPDAGEARLNDTPIGAMDRRELARRRAYLPQNPRAEWPIPVERLVALGLTPNLPAFGGLTERFEPRLSMVLETFDLTGHRLQSATTLSGGELARAMLARALIAEPDILIADEPVSGLDPRHALDTISRLRELAEGGRTIVTALHDLTLAARHATHVLALRNGQLAAFGPTAQVMTPEMLAEVFEVQACVSGAGAQTIVDFVSRTPSD